MPDKDALGTVCDDRCLYVLKCLFGARSKRRRWVGYRFIRESVLAKGEDVRKVYDTLANKVDKRGVHDSSSRFLVKVPRATPEDYLAQRQRISSEKQLNRAIKDLIDSGFVERRERRDGHRGRRHMYEYSISEEGANLYLKTDLADYINKCPASSVCVWSDEIMSCSSTLRGLADASSPSIPDNFRDARRKLEDAIKNFKALWRWRYEMPSADNRNHPSEVEDPRMVIVLDFNPTIPPK